jgi:hypothetical protein
VEPALPSACGGNTTNSTASGSVNVSSSVYSSGGSGSGVAPPELVCFVFNERTERFVFWGPNSALLLVR